MSLDAFLALLVYAFVTSITPGPNNLMLLASGVNFGIAKTVPHMLGISIGFLVLLLAVGLGLGAVLTAFPALHTGLKIAGAAYLLYLAWKTFRSTGTMLAPTDGLRPHPIGVVFRQGLLTNLLNPKMALFVLALFPQFVRPEGSVAVQIMLLATVLNLVGLAVNGAVILAASRLGRVFAGRNRFRRVPQILLGTVFAGLAIRLAFDGRR